MLWTLVLCLLTFDLMHRFKLVEDNEDFRHMSIFGRLAESGGRKNRTVTSKPATTYDSDDDIDKDLQVIGHRLLWSLNDTELSVDLKSTYRIKCRLSTEYLTLSDLKTPIEPGTLPLKLSNWKNSNEQKWKLNKTGNVYHIISLAAAKHDGNGTENFVEKMVELNNITIKPGLLSNPIRIMGFCLPCLQFRCKQPKANSRWYLIEIPRV